MANYNKSEMINDIASQTGVSRADVGAVLDAAIAKIKEQADAGMVVNLAGLGRFQMKTRAARTGRNPRTGEPVEIAESRNLVFKATKTKT